MKRDYMKKKKITIATLSVVALCLAGGLFYYVDTMNSAPPIEPIEPSSKVEDSIVVPEIENPAPTNPDDMVGDITEPDKGDIGDTSEPTTDGEVIETNPVKPSDDNPKTKEEATPPTDNTPPEVDDKGEDIPKVVEPDKPADNAPKDGDTNANGDIYLDGFGWIPYEGENTTIPGDFEITGELVGQ